MSKSKHGTAYSLGQYSEVLAAVMRAFPQALEGTDPKKTIKGVQNGEALAQALHQTLLSVVEMERKPERMIVGGLTFELFYLVQGVAKIIKEEEFLRRAKDIGADLGQKDAEYLRDHQVEIPKALRNYRFVFPGTVCDRCGSHYAPCLDWYDGRWIMDFMLLGGLFSLRYCLLRLCE